MEAMLQHYPWHVIDQLDVKEGRRVQHPSLTDSTLVDQELLNLSERI